MWPSLAASRDVLAAAAVTAEIENECLEWVEAARITQREVRAPPATFLRLIALMGPLTESRPCALRTKFEFLERNSFIVHSFAVWFN